MYHCSNCNKLSKPREAVHKVVTQKRPMKYYGEDEETGLTVVKAEGWEIVQEVIMCRSCAEGCNVQE